jgi:hypothetical protein
VCPDSIDLQDRDAPSAQNHAHAHTTQQQQQAATAKPVAVKSPLGSHQAETLREIAAETAEDLRSPRASWTNGEGADLQQYAEDLAAGVTNTLNGQANSQNGNKTKMQSANHSQQDALAIAQNGGRTVQDASDDADTDADGDADMDDDMMDKISSSPSIEDGGYHTRALPAFNQPNS